MEDDRDRHPESAREPDAPPGQVEDASQEAPPEEEETPERPDIDSLDLEELDIGEGAREPDVPRNTEDYRELEAGPTEVVSFQGSRSRTRGGEPEAETERFEFPLPSMRTVRVIVFILVNLLVLIVGAYMIYRTAGSKDQVENTQPEAPGEAPSVPKSGGDGGN